MAALLVERWPVFAVELRDALLHDGEIDLAGSVKGLTVVSMCSCTDEFCQSFHTAAPPDGAYGAGHRNLWLGQPWPDGFLILDVVDDEIRFVEVLYRPPLD
ncbi:hypothetical protein [Myceligenerans xiligouense]|uniref:Uncharacterized protein n=1 Tax=Myceligenerans xiligouense TaxID=253184 RepID=A0A3N4YMP2_9MICO|nr:hypothetical protein [Myceligenerans xiligouense]RPF20716.1 hypothetical protein EDD34_1317 [Myceligenerans xiligouense]